ncbi:MAG: TIGR03667 family PPOX class F420-dependent oxidoreductase [Anaerolineales bacterium]|jgi:PPOX class probable F420-dependent enzyme
MIDLTTEFGQRVKQHLDEEYFIWFTTVGTNMTPQPRPVWFIWEDDAFLIFSKPGARKVAHIKRHPNVALHFNTDDKADENVIVFLGMAEINASAPPAYEVPAYVEKYKDGMAELGSNPEKFSREYSVAIRVWPTKLRGW